MATASRTARNFRLGLGIAFGVSIGTISATVQRPRGDKASRHAETTDSNRGRKGGLWWVSSFIPILGTASFPSASVCEGSIAPQTNPGHTTQLRAAFQDTSQIRDPNDHPWLQAAPPAPHSLCPEERIITFLAANAAAGNIKAVKRDWSFLPPHMHAAGMEALLQNHLLVGFPRTINAIAAVHQVGVEGSKEWQAEPEGDPSYWRSRGEEALVSVYGSKYERLRQRMSSLHPVLDSIMAEHAYGRVISREGALSLRMRELCVVAVLSGQDVQPQLQSHLYGARNVGASSAEIAAVVDQTELPWGPEAQTQSRKTLVEFLDDVSPAKPGGQEEGGSGGALQPRSKM